MSHDKTTHDCTHVKLLAGPLDGLIVHLSGPTHGAGSLDVPCMAGRYVADTAPMPPYELPIWRWTTGDRDGR